MVNNSSFRILSDYALIASRQARSAEFIERVPPEIILEVVDIIYGFIEVEP